MRTVSASAKSCRQTEQVSGSPPPLLPFSFSPPLLPAPGAAAAAAAEEEEEGAPRRQRCSCVGKTSSSSCETGAAASGLSPSSRAESAS